VASVVFSVLLGLFTLAVFIGVGELFQGQGVAAETMAAGLAMALYLALAQFLVAQRGSRGLRGKWPTMVAMGAPALGMGLLASLGSGGRYGGRAWLYSATPLLVAGCLGIAAGAWTAGRVTLLALSPESCRRCLLVCAVVTCAAGLVVAAAVIPRVAADTDLQKAAPALCGIVVLDLLVAALLALSGLLAARRAISTSIRQILPTALGLLAFLAFGLAFFLAPTAVYFTHGPAMRVAAIWGVLCSAAQFVATVLVGVVALRLPAPQPA